MKQKYIKAFIDMASVFAQTSEAKRLKVGALIVKDDQIISQGVNGSPSGYPTNSCESEDGITASWVVHAELSALNKLRKSNSSSLGAEMFCNYSCCVNCAVNIVDSGILKFTYKNEYRDSSGIDYLIKNNVEVVKWEDQS